MVAGTGWIRLNEGVKICVPIREKSQKKSILRAKLAKQKMLKMGISTNESFVEIWMDSIQDMKVKELFRAVPKPCIAVCKSGKTPFTLLLQAAKAGATWVDIGFRKDKIGIQQEVKQLKKSGAKVIISHHDFKKTEPLDVLFGIMKRGWKLGADVVKIAVQIRKIPENVVLFELSKRALESGKKALVIGMGEQGKISRIGCLALGGFLTFVALDKHSATAAGQFTISEISVFSSQFV